MQPVLTKITKDMKTKKRRSKSRFNFYQLLMAVLACTLVITSTGFGQISGVYPEGPASIGKNGFRFSATYSTLLPAEALWLDGPLNRFGFGTGVGVHENIDLTFSYTRWMSKGSAYKQNAFQFAPKFSSKNKRTAFYLPLVMIYAKETNYSGEDYMETLWAVCPKLITTLVKTKGFDFALIPYAEVLFEKEFNPVLTGGLNLGMGVEVVPDMLSFRMEGGLDLRCTFSGAPLGSVGFGLYYEL
jgi:hypothetical protein